MPPSLVPIAAVPQSVPLIELFCHREAGFQGDRFLSANSECAGMGQQRRVAAGKRWMHLIPALFGAASLYYF